VDVGDWVDAGLYDPDAVGADERLELLNFLAERGCSLAEMVAAHARGRLFALAGDRIIRPDRDVYDLEQVAEITGFPVHQVRAVWRAFGLVDVGGPVASPDDVEMVRTALLVSGTLGFEPTIGLVRVMGASMARIGDATSTVVRGRMPTMSVATSGSELATATSFATIAAGVPEMGRMLDQLFRHHLESARMHFERTESWDIVGDGGIRVAVGFADLCGFTGLTQQLRMDELSQLLSGFEQIAGDIVQDHSGRLVKFIGDAVMYVTPDAVSAVAVADDLVAAAEVNGLQARAGITAGTALAMDGDYFGPVVNLAARLVGIAEPGDILATDDVVERLGDRRLSTPLGLQRMRGFTDPVSVSRLVRADGA
jgi:class 3 adenylate cyclase